MGKLLIIIGILCIAAGLFVLYHNKIPFVGKLPGDIEIERKNFKLYIPITTSIILSLLLSLIIYLINRWRQ
jgi:hypothetical protein